MEGEEAKLTSDEYFSSIFLEKRAQRCAVTVISNLKREMLAKNISEDKTSFNVLFLDPVLQSFL